jgi:hypothetical protein
VSSLDASLTSMTSADARVSVRNASERDAFAASRLCPSPSGARLARGGLLDARARNGEKAVRAIEDNASDARIAVDGRSRAVASSVGE